MEKEEEKDPQPLTDEELADYQKKEERKVWFLGSVIDFIDFIVSFFYYSASGFIQPKCSRNFTLHLSPTALYCLYRM